MNTPRLRALRVAALSPLQGATPAARLSRFCGVSGENTRAFILPRSPFCLETTMRPIIQNAPKLIAVSALSMWAKTAFSHEGHGLSGGHWHATDAWGFVAMGAMLALAIWLSRGGK
jgi:hypothetical protein